MNRHNYMLYAVLLLALLLRLYFALTTTAVPDYSDMALYNELAMSGGFPTSLPPAYPLFLRLIYSVFGAYNYTAVFFIQALLSTFTVFLVYFVTWKIANERAGIIAAAIASIYPNFIAYNLTTMTEAVTLLLVMLLLASLVIETDERRRSILAAAAICVGFYVRPAFLFLMPGVFPFVRKRMWFVGVIALLLVPWFVNGLVSEGGSSRGARMFYKSYNARSDGITNYDLSESALGSSDLPGGTYIREALDYIRGNGWETVNIIYNKSALLLCRGYDQFVLKNIAGGNKYIVYLFYYLHIPIFILGAILMIRLYDRKIGILVWPMVSYLLVTILYAFFKFRYRLPVEPMFIMASAILVDRFAHTGVFRVPRPGPAAGSTKKNNRKTRGKKRSGKQVAGLPSSAPSGTKSGLTLGELMSQVLGGIRRHWKVLLGLLIVSLSIRVLFAIFLGTVPAREETMRIMHLALEGGFGPGDPPLYPLLAKMVFSMAGGPEIIALYLVQGLIGAATALLLFGVVLHMFDMATAVIAASIAAIYMNFILYCVKVDPGILSIFTFTLLTAVAVSSLGSTHRSAACGLIVGLGTMIQPYFLFLAPGLIVFLDNRKAFLSVLALTMLPLTIVNSLMHGSFVPIYPSSLFRIGAGNFIGLDDNLAIVDKLYNNAAILLSRGWDKQRRVDFAGIVYMVRYGYVVLMILGLAGLIRYSSRDQKGLLLPVLGYVLTLVLFSRFLFQQRSIIEPVLVIYTGVLLAGGYRFLVSRLRRGAASEE